MPYIKFRLKT